jgi:calcium-dependent protein kinase
LIIQSYYIAPEVLKKLYNYKCDVWSMGIILFILLSGEPPFKGKEDEEILANVMNAPLEFKKPIWMVVSDAVKDLIRKMLTRNPL